MKLLIFLIRKRKMQLKLILNRFSKHFRRLKVKQGKIQERSNHQSHQKSHKTDPDVV